MAIRIVVTASAKYRIDTDTWTVEWKQHPQLGVVLKLSAQIGTVQQNHYIPSSAIQSIVCDDLWI